MTDVQRLLVEKNHNLIYGYCNKNKLNVEEYYGLLAEALCKSAISYEPDRNISFSSYTYKSFDNAIRYYWREAGTKKRIPTNIINSINEVVWRDTTGSELELIDMLECVDNISYSLLINDILEYLKKLYVRDRNIFILYLIGYKQSEISRELNVSQSYVSRVINNVRHDLKEEIYGK